MNLEDCQLNLILVSPHRDDAAFSLALSLGRWLAEGHRVTLLNVFTRSGYAPFVETGRMPERERLDYVSQLRRREDIEFVYALGGRINMVDLDLEDAPIRLGCDPATVCDREVDAYDPATPRIVQTLRDWVNAEQANGMCGLILPLALGHHVDHRVARDAALPLSIDVPCAFYEDLPYAMREGVRADLSRFREDTKVRFHEQLLPEHCHGIHTHPSCAKRLLAMNYPSQIDLRQAEAIANFSHRYQGAERIWANDAWQNIAARERLSTGQHDEQKELLPA
jgi:hypothetical protein